MGIFDKRNYMVIVEQVFQCTAKVILLAKWLNSGHSMRMCLTV